MPSQVTGKHMYLETLEKEPALAVCHKGLVTKGFVEEGELEVTTYLRPTTIAMTAPVVKEYMYRH